MWQFCCVLRRGTTRTNPRCRRRWWTSLSTTLSFASRKLAVCVSTPQSLCLHLESSSFTPGRKEWKSSRGNQTRWRCWGSCAGRRTNSRSPRRDSLHTPCWLWSGDSSDPELQHHGHHILVQDPVTAVEDIRLEATWSAVSTVVVGEKTKFTLILTSPSHKS